jgi:predicted ester cyclase
MSAQENKEKARRMLEEAFGQGKLEVVDEVLDPDFVCYDPNSESGAVRGADTIRQEIEWFRNAIPNLTYSVEDQVAEGDKVVTRYTAKGTHQGEFFGVAPTGKRIEMSGIQIDRFGEGVRHARGDEADGCRLRVIKPQLPAEPSWDRRARA